MVVQEAIATAMSNVDQKFDELRDLIEQLRPLRPPPTALPPSQPAPCPASAPSGSAHLGAQSGSAPLHAVTPSSGPLGLDPRAQLRLLLQKRQQQQEEERKRQQQEEERKRQRDEERKRLRDEREQKRQRLEAEAQQQREAQAVRGPHRAGSTTASEEPAVVDLSTLNLEAMSDAEVARMLAQMGENLQ